MPGQRAALCLQRVHHLRLKGLENGRESEQQAGTFQNLRTAGMIRAVTKPELVESEERVQWSCHIVSSIDWTLHDAKKPKTYPNPVQRATGPFL